MGTPGVGRQARGGVYRRRPEGSLLYRAVRENLATLREEAAEMGRGLPRYVERDFLKYRSAACWHTALHGCGARAARTSCGWPSPARAGPHADRSSRRFGTEPAVAPRSSARRAPRPTDSSGAPAACRAGLLVGAPPRSPHLTPRPHPTASAQQGPCPSYALSQLVVEESVGPETLWRSIKSGNSTLTGAAITISPSPADATSVNIRVSVEGQGGWGAPGKFKAIYIMKWIGGPRPRVDARGRQEARRGTGCGCPPRPSPAAPPFTGPRCGPGPRTPPR